MRTLEITLALALLAARPGLAATDTTIAWDEADKHVGEEATVEGTVVDVHCSPLSCLLAFEPSFNRFTAVVQARSFDVLPPADLEQRYRGKRVLVHGTIRQNESKPEIVVESPEALALAGGRRREERAGERAPGQAETLERLSGVLARVEELTERLAAVEERMDALLAQMEQRSAALAAAEEAQAPPPTAAAPPRPAYQALRSIKRGMSRAEVERLAGPPQSTESGGGGWITWYYADGHSVSFDARGHVQALSGF